jgi:hypothetical protein
MDDFLDFFLLDLNVGIAETVGAIDVVGLTVGAIVGEDDG